MGGYPLPLPSAFQTGGVATSPVRAFEETQLRILLHACGLGRGCLVRICFLLPFVFMMLVLPLPVLCLSVAVHFISAMVIPCSVLEAEAGKRQEVTCPAKVWVTQGLKPALWAHQHSDCTLLTLFTSWPGSCRATEVSFHGLLGTLTWEHASEEQRLLTDDQKL